MLTSNWLTLDLLYSLQDLPASSNKQAHQDTSLPKSLKESLMVRSVVAFKYKLLCTPSLDRQTCGHVVDGCSFVHVAGWLSSILRA